MTDKVKKKATRRSREDIAWDKYQKSLGRYTSVQERIGKLEAELSERQERLAYLGKELEWYAGHPAVQERLSEAGQSQA